MISAVMPVHNEQELLPYTLQSLQHAPINELIIILDRCTDRSQQIAENFTPPYKKTVIINNTQPQSNPMAELTELGFQHAHGDVIYTLAADIILDPATFSSEHYENYDIVGFWAVNQDFNTSLLRLTFEHLLNWMFLKYDKSMWRGGILGIKRLVWQQHHFRSTTVTYGGHNQFQEFTERAIQHGARYKQVDTCRNLHLRDNTLTKTNQIMQGKQRRKQGHGLLRVLMHSLLHLKPYVLASYLNSDLA